MKNVKSRIDSRWNNGTPRAKPEEKKDSNSDYLKKDKNKLKIGLKNSHSVPVSPSKSYHNPQKL